MEFGAESIIDGIGWPVEALPHPRRKRSPPVQESTSAKPSLLEAFSQFRSDPLRYFTVKLRRKRAEQLRRLLARPDALDLDTFNQGVWAICTSASIDGHPVKLLNDNYQLADEARLTEFEQALETGKLEFHGNSIWRAATRIYDPQRKDRSDEQTALVREALRILNDATLSPLEKAQKIDEVRGFGENTATGLVMVYHPDQFAIYNKQSQQALKKLRYSYHDIETFERAVSELKKQVGAEDFLELDWFL